jgi:dihydrofolate reductase
MFAIAAMSRNRVIGKGSAIPWRIPDEMRWFRKKTLGGVVVMGRRTFETLPKPLDGRVNVVLTRDPEPLAAAYVERFHAVRTPTSGADLVRLSLPQIPGAELCVARSVEAVESAGLPGQAWLCGGAQLYAQLLPRCAELYLSVVHREVEGDVLFPPFEHLFDLAEVAAEFPDFQVRRYVRRA